MTTVFSDDMKKLLIENGFNNRNFAITDSDFALPAEQWVKTTFSSAFLNFLFKIKADIGSEEDNDCDDFALAAVFFAKLLHHRTKNKPEYTGLAFGEYYYIKAERGAHAINFFVTNDNGLKILFFEPQTGKIINLTDAELKSNYFWRI